MRAAKLELDHMRKARNALGLAKALEEPIAILTRRGSGSIGGVRFDRKADKDRELLEFASVLDGIQKGNVPVKPVSNNRVAILAQIFMGAPPEFVAEPGESAADAVKRISAVVSEWRELANKMTGGPSAIVASEDGRLEVQLKKENAKAEISEAADYAAGTILWEELAEALENERVLEAAWLGHLGIENVRRFKNLDAASKSENPEKRLEALRKRFEIACPAALEELRAQSEIVREDRNWGWELPKEEEVPDSTAVRGNGRTEIEDMWRLRSEFPGLYKLIMDTPTEAELEARELRKNVRFTMREGVPAEFVKECVRMGIKNSEGIIELFLASGKKTGGEADAAPAEEASVKKKMWKPRALQNGNGAKPAEEKRKVEIRTREDIVGAIQLNEEARAHIRDAGFSPKDVLNAIVRGFNMAQDKRAAVGNAHMRGDPIRKNIRRYLEIEYAGRNAEKPDVEALLDYLKSVGVVQEIGSSACTRTKDDAMSIDINPENPVGKEIADRVNAVIIEVKKN